MLVPHDHFLSGESDSYGQQLAKRTERFDERSLVPDREHTIHFAVGWVNRYVDCTEGVTSCDSPCLENTVSL